MNKLDVKHQKQLIKISLDEAMQTDNIVLQDIFLQQALRLQTELDALKFKESLTKRKGKSSAITN